MMPFASVWRRNWREAKAIKRLLQCPGLPWSLNVRESEGEEFAGSLGDKMNGTYQDSMRGVR